MTTRSVFERPIAALPEHIDELGHVNNAVRSTRAMEFTGSDGRLCVRARIDWAIIDQTTGRPIGVPREVVAPFFAEG